MTALLKPVRSPPLLYGLAMLAFLLQAPEAQSGHKRTKSKKRAARASTSKLLTERRTHTRDGVREAIKSERLETLRKQAWEVIRLRDSDIEKLILRHRRHARGVDPQDAKTEIQLHLHDKIVSGQLPDNPAKLTAWIAAVTKNKMRDISRRAHRQRTRELSTARPDELEQLDLTLQPRPPPTPEQLLSTREQILSTRSALSRFNPKQQQLIEYRLEGLTWRGVANKLGITEANARVQGNRLLERLRRYLQETDSPDTPPHRPGNH